MTGMLRRLVAIVRNILLWTLAALPLSPSIAALILFGPDCYRPKQAGDISSESCLVRLATMAPIGIVFGGLSSDEDPLSILGPTIVMTAFGFGVLGAAGQVYWRRRKAELP